LQPVAAKAHTGAAPRAELALLQLCQPVSCISEANDALRSVLAQLPPTSNQLSIVYESQQRQQQIGVDGFGFEPAWMEQRLSQHLAFWKGAAPPERAPDEELWKCDACQHHRVCSNAELLDPAYEW
jgi:hypothetical protein